MTNEKTIDDLISVAFENLDQKNYTTAKKLFDALIEQLPNERLGYVGKAIAVAGTNDTKGTKSLFKLIYIAKEKTTSSVYEADTLKLINYPILKNDITLLMIASYCVHFNAVQALLDMGANVNQRSANNVTALWFVCSFVLPKERTTEGRKIVKLLIKNGAELNATNVEGRTAYSKDTDSKIARILLKQCSIEIKKNNADKDFYIALKKRIKTDLLPKKLKILIPVITVSLTAAILILCRVFFGRLIGVLMSIFTLLSCRQINVQQAEVDEFKIGIFGCITALVALIIYALGFIVSFVSDCSDFAYGMLIPYML